MIRAQEVAERLRYPTAGPAPPDEVRLDSRGSEGHFQGSSCSPAAPDTRLGTARTLAKFGAALPHGASTWQSTRRRTSRAGKFASVTSGGTSGTSLQNKTPHRRKQKQRNVVSQQDTLNVSLPQEKCHYSQKHW